MLPATKITDPYSPSARAKASVKPVKIAGSRLGKITQRKICQRDAPSDDAASSTSASRLSKTGCTVRPTNGKLVKVSTSTMARREYAPSMPRGTRNWPNQPVGAYREEYTRPATAVGRAKGK